MATINENNPINVIENNLSRNLTNFPLIISNALENIPKKSDADILLYHQRVVKEYVVHNHTTRGLLVVHGMGYGKTITAVAIAEEMKKYRKVIVLLSKSLQDNFKQNIKKYRKSSTDNSAISDIDEYDGYSFVSFNASNMLTQIKRVATDDGYVPDDLEEKLEALLTMNLDNKLLIVDEAHNLFNAITNGSKNAVGLYNTVMRSKNLKLVFLTGTPIVNDPFELVPCYNMLKNNIADQSGHGGHSGQNSRGGHTTQIVKSDSTHKKYNHASYEQNYSVLPEIWKDFYKYFVDIYNMEPKNKTKFMNRIVGMTSFYGADPSIFTDSTDVVIKRNGFPDELPTIIKRIPMSKPQYSRYLLARDREIEEASRSYGKDSMENLLKPRMIGTSSYRVNSRQISNYLLPDYIVENGERIVENIKKHDLDDLDMRSPKFKVLVDDIEKSNGSSLVYSEFITGTLSVLELVLKNRGWKKWGEKDKLDDKVVNLDKVDNVDKNTNDTNDTNNYTDKKPVIGGYFINSDSSGSEEDSNYSETEMHIDDHIDGNMTVSDESNINNTFDNIVKPVIGGYFINSDSSGSDDSDKDDRDYANDSDSDYANDSDSDNDHHNRYVIDDHTDYIGGGKIAKLKNETKSVKGEHKKVSMTYAIISGAVPSEERSTILSAYNSGDQIKVLLVSSVGAEGLDLKGCRNVFIIEPYWNDARLSQIKARAIRLNSHVDLPESERNVQPYIYLSTYPTSVRSTQFPLFTSAYDNMEDTISSEIKSKRDKLEPYTTDEELYRKSIHHKKLINRFMKLLIEASIDCSVHGFDNCNICQPNDRELFHPDIITDMKTRSSCTPLIREKVKTKEIIYNGEKYYYMYDLERAKIDDVYNGLVVFKYNDDIGGYIEVSNRDEIYAQIK